MSDDLQVVIAPSYREPVMDFGPEIEVQGSRVFLNTLVDHLKLPVPGAYIIKQRCPWMKEWDGKKSYASIPNPEVCDRVIIPKGLTHLVRNFCQSNDVSFVETLPPPASQIAFDNLLNIELDEIQVDTCKVMLEHETCSVELKTGSGKTEVMCNLIACAFKANKGFRVCVIVPKVTLLHQTAKRIEKRVPALKGYVGLLGDSRRELTCPVTVCTFHSASKQDEDVMAWKKKIDILIFDEAHHAGANSWKKILKDSTKVQRFWALSGKVTYYSKDKAIAQRDLEALFGPPVLRGENTERTCPVVVYAYKSPKWKKNFDFKGPLYTSLVDGVPVDIKETPQSPLVRAVWRGADSSGEYPPEVYLPVVKRRGKFVIVPEEGEPPLEPPLAESEVVMFRPFAGIFDGDRRIKSYAVASYHTEAEKGLVDYHFRMRWSVDLAFQCNARGEAFVITVPRLRQIDTLVEWCRHFGLAVSGVHGKLKSSEGRNRLDALASGSLCGLVCLYSVISEGVDIPNLVHLIKLDGIHDEQVLEQQKGRVQRKFEGKECGYVHIPMDQHLPSLARNARKMISYFNLISKETAVSVVPVNW